MFGQTLINSFNLHLPQGKFDHYENETITNLNRKGMGGVLVIQPSGKLGVITKISDAGIQVMDLAIVDLKTKITMFNEVTPLFCDHKNWLALNQACHGRWVINDWESDLKENKNDPNKAYVIAIHPLGKGVGFVFHLKYHGMSEMITATIKIYRGDQYKNMWMASYPIPSRYTKNETIEIFKYLRDYYEFQMKPACTIDSSKLDEMANILEHSKYGPNYCWLDWKNPY